MLFGCAIGYLGISPISGLMGMAGDFSLIIPYGVRVKGFSCDWLGLRVAWSIGSGLRACRSSGSGLRVRSPDDHVMLLFPLYLTGEFSLSPFPHPLFPSHYWLLNHSPTSSTQNDFPFCPVCWWHDGRTSPPQSTSPIGRFPSLWLIWRVILIEPCYRILLATLLSATSPSSVGGLMLPIRRLTTSNAGSLTWRES